jgi:hypothetical protein
LLASGPVSSVATAPESAGPEPRTPAVQSRSPRLTAGSVLGLAAAAGIVVLAFLSSGNSDPSAPLTGGYAWSEMTVTLLGAVAVAAAVLVGARGRAWGAGAVALFAVFTAFAALSIVWSVQPDWSWYGANQLLSYLSAFAGAAALARVFPERWRVLLGALTVGMVALSAYALLAKVFPATLTPANTYGRLTAPFGYWNAIGLAAAMGLPGCLWAGARRDGHRLLRAASVPAMTLLISAVVLSYSRSAVLAAVLGGGACLAFAPLRLRSALMLALGALGALPIVLWALGHDALTGDNILPAPQDAAGHSFGVILAVVLVIVAAVGFAAVLAMERVSVSDGVRRRVGTVLVGLVALLPVLAVVALAASSRGLTGEVSHAWHTLTSSTNDAGNTSSRLSQLGSSRPLYWHQGLQVGSHALLKGVGELGYGIARLRYTTSTAKTDQAHSYLVQTFADLGLIGLALTLALLVAWARAAVRALAPRARWAALMPEPAAERQGLVVMAAIVLAFGIQSLLDWTWYFPALTVPALLCAGWLAGRGPLAAPVGRRRQRPSRLRDRPGAGAAITGLVAVALVAAWFMWEPLHSAQALRTAENADTNAAALSGARTAADADPLAVEPLNFAATVQQQLRNDPAARAELIKATQRQPDNPEPWLWLGSFDLQTGDILPALAALQHVITLDQPADRNRQLAVAELNQAQAVVRAKAAGKVSGRRPARARAGKSAAGRAARPRRRR